ncbi:MAG: SDR family NAD(P)-dependent oxidoreductase [Sulfuricurvum sp.]|uniref:SDR family NAD(P)-dependent oxidoreductase n=1 Tax=Sulfuricurvum sp. TaxID=2025608 RepID=UPI0026025647|nr:SDR family NAD(P)-dependent oxidoreductase [Sulfuricurvum sp.]MDD2828173.1 SDR family NAD(P)-dependent oxidoreductase [Sulfuricurvum sp.]MDD4949872.1 SDR family NAD(P)-dependent oxidoreductase [Sulfuricurvum sp.]
MRIIITGASSGLGEALALHYATNENRLVLIARREDRLATVAQRCRDRGSEVETIVADVNDFERMRVIGNYLGEQPIDRIILNAGVSVGHGGGVTPFEDFHRVFKTNFLSVHALLEPIIPKLIEQRFGEIVFISSLASLFSMPTSIAYSSSKRALNAYAEGLHYQLKPYGITIMTIMPGFIDSEMTQKNRFKMPFLLSTDKGIERITHAIERKKIRYAFPFRFSLMIRILTLLPQPLRDKIVHFLNFKKGA